jgi:hypothetical protein
MSSSKSKAKKHSSKKEHQHDIPPVQTAKGRRPHKEEPAEPYQPSLLNETDLQPQQTAFAKPEEPVATEVPAHEPILEGQPAPKQKRTKMDVKEQLETVKGVVQLGTAIVKSSFPKPFEMAEKVVEDWKQDGDFSELPISQPLVQFYVGLGLRKAKQTEKDLEQKLENAGVLPVVRQQWQRAQKLFK